VKGAGIENTKGALFMEIGVWKRRGIGLNGIISVRGGGKRGDTLKIRRSTRQKEKDLSILSKSWMGGVVGGERSRIDAESNCFYVVGKGRTSANEEGHSQYRA